MKQIAIREGFNTLCKHGHNFIKNNGQTILTAGAVIGVFTTTVLMYDASPKAKKILEEAKDEPVKDRIISVAPVLAPTIISGGLTVLCVVGAHKVNTRKQAALVAAYNLSATTLKEYRDKVRELSGSKKETAIHDDIVKDRLEANPVSSTRILQTGMGECLCMDLFSGRYFYSSAEAIRQAVNSVNARLYRENFIPLNDLYYELNLPRIKLGDDLGWTITTVNELIEVRFTSLLTENKEPCLVMDFDVDPKFA